MIAEVSAKLLTQFVECLEGKLDGSPAADTPGDDATEAAKEQADDSVDVPVETTGNPAAEEAKAQAPDAPLATESPKAQADAPKVRKIEHEASEPVDLLGSAGAPIAKRLAPVGAIIFLLILLGRRRSKKRRS